jgi:hypothetical protein
MKQKKTERNQKQTRKKPKKFIDIVLMERLGLELGCSAVS